MPIRGGLADLGGLERAQFLHHFAGDRLNVVFVQVFIEPGEDGFVAGLGALACLGKPARCRIGPAIGRSLTEARLAPRTRTRDGFKLFRIRIGACLSPSNCPAK